MRKSYLYFWGLVILLLVVGKVGQAQDSLGMRCLSSLEYWSGANKIQMVGNLVYVVGISAMHIVSLADPANPVTIGRFTWYQYTGTTGGIYVLSNRAYLGTYYGGFVLDVSDPSNAVALGQWYSGHMSDISFVHGDYAIAQSDEGYPYVLDVSDPANVHQIGDFPGIAGPQEGVGMAGDYLCLTGFPGGLVLYDMSDPAEPQWMASIDTVFNTSHATISGNYAYVATQYHGLRIIDLSNPLQPVEVAACDSSGQTRDVTVTGSHAVTMKYSEGNFYLNIWNIANPAQPFFEGMIPTQSIGSYRVSSSGNLVCTTAAEPGHAVMVVDISNPYVPSEVSSFGPSGGCSRMEIGGSTAYGAGGGLWTVDIADPYHLSELTHMDGSHVQGIDVAIRGNYAYLLAELDVAGTNGVVVFEVSNPAEPESVGSVIQEDGRKIVLAGDYAYVAGVHSLYTLSLVNPALPQCVNTLGLPTAAPDLGLAVSGYLYFGAWSTFCVYSLSNPAAPQLVGSCELGGGWVFDLATAGNHVYVARGHGGMRIIDVEDPAHPSEVNWIDGYWVGSVAASGNMVIMDDRTAISIYDVTYPDEPRLVGYYATDEYITDMEIQGQYLFTTSISEFRAYQCDALTNLIAPTEPLPTEFALLPPYPNPFNSLLTIPFAIAYQKEVKINIFNILGQKVQEFVLPPQSPGMHRVIWSSSEFASGIYWVHMSANGHEYEQKVVLLR